MPRFTLRDLFWATTLIAAAVALWCAAEQLSQSPHWGLPAGILRIISFCTLGAGIGAMFQRKRRGAILVLVAVFALGCSLGIIALVERVIHH